MIDIIRQHIVPAAYAVLPPAMRSEEATAMLLAIGWQESRFEHRTQVGGPARGYWQFEQMGGVNGVLGHERTRHHAVEALAALHYPATVTPWAVYNAIADNDVLACVFARLLLWSMPYRLPKADEPDVAWAQYRHAWRPGKPHPKTWGEAWRIAWT